MNYLLLIWADGLPTPEQLEDFLAGIDVVFSADRGQAIELAATHPIARYYTIEVRPFYSE
jgi:hypothetical protein